ncbi:MAG: TRAP transporter substrate-binding protein [Clostridiales bacterium]
MKHWRIFTTMVFLLAACIVLTGCGGNGDTKVTAAGGSQGSEGPTSPAAAAPAVAEYIIKVGHTTSENHSSHLTFVKFKELVEAKSAGRIGVEIYPNGTLGNDRECIEGVQMGTITMTGISSAMVAQFEKSLSIFDLPFLFPNRETAYKVFEDPAVGGVLKTNMEAKGFVCLGFAEAGYRNLTTTAKQVKTMADLKGMKIRTMSSNYHVAAWEAYGASPTPISFSELYTALQQKTVDGQENPYGLILSQKFNEVQPYCTETGHILTVVPLIINKEFVDSLPDDLEKAVLEAGAEAVQYNYGLAQEEEETAKQELIDSGMEIFPLANEEKDKFRKAAMVVYDAMKAEIGSDIIDAALVHLN